MLRKILWLFESWGALLCRDLEFFRYNRKL